MTNGITGLNMRFMQNLLNSPNSGLKTKQQRQSQLLSSEYMRPIVGNRFRQDSACPCASDMHDDDNDHNNDHNDRNDREDFVEPEHETIDEKKKRILAILHNAYGDKVHEHDHENHKHHRDNHRDQRDIHKDHRDIHKDHKDPREDPRDHKDWDPRDRKDPREDPREDHRHIRPDDVDARRRPLVPVGGSHVANTRHAQKLREDDENTEKTAPFDASKSAVLIFVKWCGFCKKQLAEIDDIKRSLAKNGIKVHTVDAEKNAFTKDFAAKNNANGFPHTVLFDKNGKKVDEISGYRPAQKFVPEVVAKLRNE